MDASGIGITTVTIIYVLGLTLFIRKVIVSKRRNNPINRRLVFSAILGGVMLIFLILSQVILG